MKPLIAPSFRNSYQALQNELPHATLLFGEVGAGLTTLARELAGGRLEQVIEPTNTKGDVDLRRGSISVETVRALYTTTRGKSVAPRVVIIKHAERLTGQAQNALLKLLEEPPEAMKFILTSYQLNHLLPTVRSRLQQHQVPRISDLQSLKLLDRHPKLTSDERRQILFVAAGRPGLLHHLASNPATRQKLVDMMQLARKFITTTSRYERLKIVAGLMTSREQALDFVECCLSILWHQLAQKSDAGTVKLTNRIMHAHDMLVRNANPRLQLANLVLQ